MAFVRFTMTEFEGVLAASIRRLVDARGLTGVQIGREPLTGQEVIYRIKGLGKGLTYIKIYSSIEPGSGMSRDYAEDALRFVLVDDVSDKPLTEKLAHVKRIDTWAKNMDKRLELLFDEAAKLQMCECGSPKIEREGKYGKFFGCSNYYAAHGNKAVAIGSRG